MGVSVGSQPQNEQGGSAAMASSLSWSFPLCRRWRLVDVWAVAASPMPPMARRSPQDRTYIAMKGVRAAAGGDGPSLFK